MPYSSNLYNITVADAFPLLTTLRLTLSSFNHLTDTSAVFAYGSDAEVARFTCWMPHNSPAESAPWIEGIKGNDSVKPGQRQHCWAIRMRGSDGAAVGAVEFVQGRADVARVDYVPARPQWGKGLMTEAVTAVLEWAFRELPELTSVRSGGLAANLGAKFGGAKCEVLHHQVSPDAWVLRHS